MSKEIRAERIKNVILENSTYEELANWPRRLAST